MLIDLKKKIIFVAGLKTASTTIERIFEKKVDIRLVRSEWGKHDSVGQIENKFGWIFSKTPVEQFLVWGVIRDPFDWLWSLYTSHQDPKFSQNTALYTGSMTFGEFYDDWRARHPGQCRPQSLRFKRHKDEEVCANFLIPFENLSDGIVFMAQKYDCELRDIPHLNRSTETVKERQGLVELEDRILDDYREDFDALRTARSEWFRLQHKTTARA